MDTESLYFFLSSGIVFGLSSGIAPGPLLTVSITETIRGGFPAGLRVSLAPVCTDAPLIILSWLLLSRLENMSWFLGLVSLSGAAFLGWLAWESFRVADVDVPEETVRERGVLRRAVLTNLLNPAPYVFWATVGAPMVLRAAEHSAASVSSFLAGFFVCIVGAKVAIAGLVTRFQHFLRSRLYLTLMRLMGLALAIFAVIFLRQAWGYLF